MSAVREVRLGDVVRIEREIVKPADISDGTIYVGLEHIETGGRFVNVAPVNAGDIASSKFAFTGNHVLYGKLRPYLAKIATPDFGGVCSTDILPLLPTKEVDRAYLRWVLLTPPLIAAANLRTSGANLPRISPSALGDLRIPLLPLDRQRNVAAILDCADALRTKRRAALAQLDTLTRAIFLDIFGDPATNPKGWPRATMCEVVAGDYGIKAGPFGSSLKKEEYTSRGYRVYGQEQVLAGRFDIGDYYISERKYQQLKSCAVREGDLLLTLVGSFGKVLIVPTGIEPGIINPRLLKISPDSEKVTSQYLASLLLQPATQLHFERISHGGTMGILNAGVVKRLPIPVPPLQLQQEFGRRLEYMARLDVRIRSSMQSFDALFASLQHRAFRGEL
jgi:type I restriction enzyme S subunit